MKKKIFFLIFFLLFLIFSTSQVYALISTTKLEDELKSDNWQMGSHIFENINKTISSLMLLVGGTTDSELHKKFPIGGGAIEGVSNLIATISINPPASSVEYFADLGKNLGIAKPVYAQSGVGFRGLKPVLPLWKKFRDISYLFFTIIFVVIGFAIMFRVKLNPQTVISIQNAIPRIIVALILVTFSYAIAGLLIDFTYIASAFFVNVIDPRNLLSSLAQFSEDLGIGGGGNENPNSLVFQLLFMGRGSWYAYIIASHFLNPAVVIADFFHAPAEVIRAILNLSIFLIPVSGSAILVALILSIALLFALIKLLFSLLKSYVSVLINIIFGPLRIMLGVVPGQNAFGGWIKSLIADLSVFPATIIMLALTSKIVELAGGSEPLWIPSPIRPPGITQFGGSASINLIGAIIGYGMLLLMPKIADMVKEALQVKPFPYGTAIGAPLAGAVGAITYIPREAVGLVTAGAKERAVKTIAGLSMQEIQQKGPWTAFKEGWKRTGEQMRRG